MKKPYVYIIGIRGNMARRYIAVLNHLEVPYTGHDIGGKLSVLDAPKATHFLICSPTDKHLDHIESVLRFHKPILCEKPLTKCVSTLEAFEQRNVLSMGLISMVNQYAYLVNRMSYGESFYDYFKSGNDGLAWDCINIIGLAEKRPVLKAEAPVWNCQINGKKLSIEGMDHAYIRMIKDFLYNPKSNYAYARKAHDKVIEWCKY